MLDRQDLSELHDQDLPLHVLEQDYIQALFLQELYEKSDNLVFKGGTFLKHAHGLDRFSEDLDFTAQSNNIEKDLRNAKNSLSKYGVDAEIDQVEEREISFTCRLKYTGPLYNGSERSKGTIDIDVSKREDVLLEPEWVRMFFEYPEVRVVNALGLKKKELLAEKLRALSTRDKARDLYDCWFLVKQGAELDKELFERKIDVVDAEPIIKITINEDNWERDLDMFLQNPPNYSEVKKNLLDKLEENGFEVKT